jgi:nicotinate-nucleotide adenylyltransferase
MTSKKKTPHPNPLPTGERGKRGLAEYLKVPMAAPKMRIGLLGGSFNPAHDGHRHISLVALRRLGLDRVWWLVSPGNPLKGKAKAPELSARVAAARAIAHHPRIAVTGFEAALGSAYTVDTLRFLKQRFPAVDFIWLMGADNLIDFHRWRGWEELFGMVPIAVLDRPGFRLKARASKAAQRFAAAAIDESDAGGLALLAPPAWTMVSLPLSGLSSTGLRDRPRQGDASNAKNAKAKKGQSQTPQSGKVREKERENGGRGAQWQSGEGRQEGRQARQEGH